MPRLLVQLAAQAGKTPEECTSQAHRELAKGNFLDGFALHESRWDMPEFREQTAGDPSRQLHRLEDARGKRVLLFHEQGLGDIILMLRFVPAFVRMAEAVALAVQPPLQRLASRIPGIHGVITLGDTYQEPDLYCPIMSLPYLLRTRLATLPATVPYLSLPQGLVAAWAERLGPKTKPRVGLAIRGSAANIKNQERSISAELLRPLLALDHIEFHLIADQVSEADSAVLREAGVRVHTAELHDLADAGALASNMDLVISVCTSIAHLAGALALPVWVPLTFQPYWAWMLNGVTTPWYPTARLFRQETPGDWAPVVRELRDRLIEALPPTG